MDASCSCPNHSVPNAFCCRWDPSAFDVSPTFTSSISNITFYYNSTADSYDNAEAGCNIGGGHLATYTSIVSELLLLDVKAAQA